MHRAATITLVVAAAIVVGACGGPDDAETKLAEACERQIEQVHGDTSDTPIAPSTQERADNTTLVECAGQRTRIVAADEETAEDDAEAEPDAEPEAEPDADAEAPADPADDAPASDDAGGATADAAAADEEDSESEPTPVELDPEARELFTQTCGGCHALSDAETNGAVGPSLDGTQLAAADIESLIEQGRGAMPANLLSGDDASSVAEYVAGAASQSADE